jgi:hypothetical protein
MGRRVLAWIPQHLFNQLLLILAAMAALRLVIRSGTAESKGQHAPAKGIGLQPFPGSRR